MYCKLSTQYKYVFLRILSFVLIVLMLMPLYACSDTTPSLPDATISLPTGEETPSVGEHTPIISENQVIRFADINFENAVRDAVGKKVESVYVSDVQKLTTFSARVCGISDISEIMYFTNLEYLDLRGNHITDFMPIGNLRNLKYLDISKNFSVMSGNKEKGLDLTPVQNLVLLETLIASGNLITDITPLSGLICLKELDLQNNRLTDVSALASCTALESLNISSNYGINSVTMNEQGISSIACVSNMIKLHTLLAGNNVLTSLEGVEGLPELKYVDITRNYVMDLTPLATCSKLDTLLAPYNNLLDLSGIANHPTIRELDIQVNRIHYVQEILTMDSLEIFRYEGNQILDYRPIDLFEKELGNHG